MDIKRVSPPGITVSVTQNHTTTHRDNGATMDVALVAVHFADDEKPAADDVIDCLAIVRNRRTGERTIRHFMAEPGDVHWQRAVDWELELLAATAPVQLLDADGFPQDDGADR